MALNITGGRTHPPVRLVFDSAEVKADVERPYALAVFLSPEPGEAARGIHQVLVQSEHTGQLAAMIETVVRYGISAGVMQTVLENIAGSPTQASLIQFDPPPRDVPPGRR